MSKTAEVSILTGGQMKMAERLNDRVTDLRVGEIKANKKAAELRVRNKFKKKHGINGIESRLAKAKAKVEDLEEELRSAREAMREDMAEEMAKIEEKFADSLSAENARSVNAGITMLAHSLPPDLRDVILPKDTKKLLTG